MSCPKCEEARLAGKKYCTGYSLCTSDPLTVSVSIIAACFSLQHDLFYIIISVTNRNCSHCTSVSIAVLPSEAFLLCPTHKHAPVAGVGITRIILLVLSRILKSSFTYPEPADIFTVIESFVHAFSYSEPITSP